MTRVAARRRSPPGEPRLVGLLYVAPALIAFLIFGVWPFLQTIQISTWRWRGIGEPVDVGLDNYVQILSDPDLMMAFVRSGILILFASILPVCIGLLLAALLSRIRIRGIGSYRVLLFLPQTIAMVVIAIAWGWIYAKDGIINEGLRLIGLGGIARAWLGDFDLALVAIGLVGTWLNAGLCMVFFVAGVQKIPLDLYDAARVDGAGPWREFRAVTLPGLRNEIVVALTLTVIFALRNFDLIWVTTGGGPGDATTVPSILLYEFGFESRRLGTGSAIAVLMTILILIVSVLIVRLGERGEDERTWRSVGFERAATHALLIVFSLVAVYPLVSVLFLALSRQSDLVTGFTIPTDPSLDSFRTAWTDGGFDQALLNSLIVAVTVTVGSVTLSVLSGYALGTMRFPGATLVFFILMTGLIIPWESLIIPLYRIFRGWGLTESLWALILPQIGVSVCLGTFWMRSFFRTTPRAIVDAARVDGAGHFRTLVGILTPAAWPAILTLSVLVFMYTWNDFLLALVMNPGGDVLTAPLALSYFAGSQRQTDQTVVAAAAVLVALPVVAAYILLQRQFIRGFLTGAVRE